MQHMRSQDSVWCGKACSSLATLNGCHADGVIGLQSVWESFSEALLHWVNVPVNLVSRVLVAIL